MVERVEGECTMSVEMCFWVCIFEFSIFSLLQKSCTICGLREDDEELTKKGRRALMTPPTKESSAKNASRNAYRVSPATVRYY